MLEEITGHDNPANGQHDQVNDALKHLRRLVVDGLRHGFFEYTVSCEMKRKGDRHLVIHAGKNHKFIISKDDLTR